MEGCSKYCSYCVVPYTRGEEVSRPLGDVLTEIAVLADQGVKEINLLGQNVNAYLGVVDDGGIADFALLIEYIHEIPGIERIRYTTSHPKEFTSRLIASYSVLPKLVSHLHLPVQSGSDRILAAMKRGYSVLEYKSIVRRLRDIRPQLSLSSDFIVGFPGETEEDFEATIQLVKELNFDDSYSFIYSARPGTPAADLPDDTPQSVKLERLQRLQAQIQLQARKIGLDMVGSTQRILVEGISKKSSDEVSGRADNNRVVNFPGDKALIGHFVNIRITEALSHSLRGEVVGI
jgi:tRNA-2-methylthio-N6-dimethylallyladenosine synthase